jgi:P27 family predicted phage terminase small subunit
MGTRGPVKTPPHLHALRSGQEPPAPRLPPVAPGAGRKLNPPAWLSASGKRAFTRIVAELTDAWPDSVAPMDIPALALLAETYAVAQAAATSMRTDKGNEPQPLEIDHAHGGQRRKSPAWQMFREATNAYLNAARDYGLTLAARLRLELDVAATITPPAEGDDEDDAILFG